MTFVPRVTILATLALATFAARRQEPRRFREHTVATGLSLGYQLVAVDLNRDGRADLIAVDERGTELAWYENPGWQRHVLAADVPRTINVDVSDIDGDGVPEIAIAYRFESKPAASIGILGLLRHDGDVRRPWKLTEIDRVPSAHRVRFANLDGKGRNVLLMAPMVGLTAQPPGYDTPVPIYAYRAPAWKRELVSEELHGVLHSIYPVNWDGNGRQQLLTASFYGLRLFRRSARGAWTSQEIAKGTPEPCPRCGSSEVFMGHLGKQRFLAAIEPWHGTDVVIYRERARNWDRKVIDNSFQNGHALAVGDLDGQGHSDVVAGFRGTGFQLYLYSALDRSGRLWDRRVLDPGGIAAADCKILDLNGDHRPDIACIGASTQNIKWYENQGPLIPATR